MRRIGVIAGLKRELACIGRPPPPHILTFAAGGSSERAFARAQGWAGDGRVDALMSFGLCGGLDPALPPGALLISHRLVGAGGALLEFDGAWAARVAEIVPQASLATLATVTTPVAGIAEKAALFRQTGAPAVDMESRGVAEAARDAGLPFVAVRAVADPASRSLPQSAIAGFNAAGRLRPFRVLFGLLARPGDVAALIRLAGDAREGYRALASAVAAGALEIPRPVE